ncbi:hypothetical protein KAI87_04295, partial [Myxococcota bacterium]|nr:hypothetical protein [Myxococcota bacterium]
SDKSSYSFILVLDGPIGPDAELENTLFKAGCDDALLTFRGTTGFLEFDREASSFDEAVESAISQVEGIGHEITVLRVENLSEPQSASMRENYDFSNSKKNPYAKQLQKQGDSVESRSDLEQKVDYVLKKRGNVLKRLGQ